MKIIANPKIAFIGNPTIGTGLWRYSYETKREIDKITPDVDELNLNYAKNQIDIPGKKKITLSKLRIDYKYFWYLRNQHKIPDYPLYHLANQNLSFLNVRPKIITVYDIFHVSNPKNMLERIFGLFMYSGIKKAKHIISGSDHTKREIIKYYGIDPKIITTVYAGVSPKYFTLGNAKKICQIKRKYSIPSDIPILLHTSNEQGHKNFDKILKALRILRKNNLLSKFLLIKVGKAQYAKDRNRHKKLINKYSLDNYVKFLEFIPDVDLPYLYQLADVFIFPSEREGFGLPIIESMASCCPVITSNTSSLPEVAGKAAVMIDPNDVDELAKSIATVVTNKRVRTILINNGLKNAKKFSWRKTAEKTIRVYKSVLKDLDA